MVVRKSARREREREKQFIIQRDSSMRECVFLLPVHFFRVGVAHEQCKRRLSDAANDTRARGASHAPRTEERRNNKEESFERRRPHHLPCRQSIIIIIIILFTSISMVVLELCDIKSCFFVCCFFVHPRKCFVQQKKNETKRNEMKCRIILSRMGWFWNEKNFFVF